MRRFMVCRIDVRVSANYGKDKKMYLKNIETIYGKEKNAEWKINYGKEKKIKLKKNETENGKEKNAKWKINYGKEK